MDAAKTPESPRLAFMHIHKVGGVSVERAIKGSFPQSSVCPKYQVKDYGDLSYEDISGFDIYWGHFDMSFMRTMPPEFVRAVVFRNPLDQSLSLFNHVASREVHPMHAKLKAAGSYAEFMAAVRGTRNQLSKTILGRNRYQALVSDFSLDFEGRRRIAVAEMRENLEQIDVVGVTHQLSQFSKALGRRLGVELAAPKVENANPYKVLTKDSMTEADRAAFRHHSRLDMVLYRQLEVDVLGTSATG